MHEPPTPLVSRVNRRTVVRWIAGSAVALPLGLVGLREGAEANSRTTRSARSTSTTSVAPAAARSRVMSVASLSLTASGSASSAKLSATTRILSNGAGVSRARVNLEFTRPGGAKTRVSGYTNSAGSVTISRTFSGAGTYTVRVTSVSARGYTYDASRNAVTTASVSIGESAAPPANPTPTPTPPPNPTPTPSPTPSPQPAPPQSSGWSWSSIQAAVDAAAAGATVTVPAGVYRETVTIRKQLTLAGQPGAIIDGRNSDGAGAVRDRWVRIEADGVTVRGFEMRYANNPNQQGALSNDGRSNVTFDSLNLHHANGAAISLRAAQTQQDARNVHVANCTIHDNGQLGIHGWGTLDSLIENTTVFANNTNNVDVGWEAGGMKVSETRRLTVRNSEIYGNNGPGLWYDINCTDCTIDGNRIHGNKCPGIFYEVSRGAVIRNNRIWANGFGSTGWVEGAGIRLANTRDCVVENNTVAWNADGICISMQNRTDWPGNQEIVGNTLRNNLVAITNPSSEHNTMGLAFVWDTDNGSRSWSHSGNQMYHENPGAPWACGGPEGWGPNDADWFRQFDANGAWLSRQEVQSRLAAAGLPTTP